MIAKIQVLAAPRAGSKRSAFLQIVSITSWVSSSAMPAPVPRAINCPLTRGA